MQCGEVEPEVVGVEVAVVGDVLELFQFVLGALSGFAEEQAAIEPTGEVSAFAIGAGSFGGFHQEGGTGCDEESENVHIESCAEVVRVGDEGVANAGIEEAGEGAGACERCV